MKSLITKLIKLQLQPYRSEHIDFEDLMNRYSKKSADKVQVQLQELQEAEAIQYEREEFGYRIELLNLQLLKSYSHTV